MLVTTNCGYWGSFCKEKGKLAVQILFEIFTKNYIYNNTVRKCCTLYNFSARPVRVHL